MTISSAWAWLRPKEAAAIAAARQVLVGCLIGLLHYLFFASGSERVVERNAAIKRRQNLGEIAHLFDAMLMQPTREFPIEILFAHLPDLRLGKRDCRIAMSDHAEPEAGPHLAAVIGVADIMAHPAGMDRRLEETGPGANRDRAGGLVFSHIEGFGRVVEVDAQLEQRAILAGQIFMHQMRGADILAVLAVFPAAIDMIGRMPQTVPFDVAEPGEPPIDHFGAAAGHAGKAGDDPFAVLDLLIARFEREVARLQQIVRLFKSHRHLPPSEADLVAALESEHLASLGRRCDRISQLFEDAAHLGDLLGIGGGQLAAADIERIFEADADAAAHHRSLGREGNLGAAGGEHGPAIIIAEQAIGGFFHEDEIAHLRADAAENAEDELHEERRPDELAIDEMRQIVEMADIVAFVLEAHAVAVAERFQDALDVAERVT